MYVSVCCLYVCLWATCIPSALGEQKKASELLTPELQVVVGHNVSALARPGAF